MKILLILAVCIWPISAKATLVTSRYLKIHDTNVKLEIHETKEAQQLRILFEDVPVLTIDPIFENRSEYELNRVEEVLKEMTLEEFDGMYQYDC